MIILPTRRGILKPASVAALRAQDVFGVALATGAGLQAAIDALPLTAKDLIIVKNRAAATNWDWRSTRDLTKTLASNTTAAQATAAAYSGTANHVAHVFKKHTRFYNEVTYTGNGTTQQIAHGLDPSVSVGMLVVKRLDATGAWPVWHRAFAAGEYVVLNTTQTRAASDATIFGDNTISIAPTSTQFTVGNNTTLNASGGSYIAYIFAHDTASDGVIQCGSYAGNGSSTGPVVTLGWEPQLIDVKRSVGGVGNWNRLDQTRGFSASTDQELQLNTTAVEAGSGRADPLSTGFQPQTSVTEWNAASSTYIYLAIRKAA